MYLFKDYLLLFTIINMLDFLPIIINDTNYIITAEQCFSYYYTVEYYFLSYFNSCLFIV